MFNSDRSSCLRIGGHIVIDRIFEEYGIPQLLNKQFNAKEAGLFRDLVAYSIITESNVGQYYPDYAYNHSLFDEDMHTYSDSKVSSWCLSPMCYTFRQLNVNKYTIKRMN